MSHPATIRITSQQREYVSALLSADSAFADLIRSLPNVRVEQEAIVADRCDAAILSEYFSDRLAKAGFDESYQPNNEGVVIERLIDAFFSVIVGE